MAARWSQSEERVRADKAILQRVGEHRLGKAHRGGVLASEALGGLAVDPLKVRLAEHGDEGPEHLLVLPTSGLAPTPQLSRLGGPSLGQRGARLPRVSLSIHRVALGALRTFERVKGADPALRAAFVDLDAPLASSLHDRHRPSSHSLISESRNLRLFEPGAGGCHGNPSSRMRISTHRGERPQKRAASRLSTNGSHEERRVMVNSSPNAPPRDGCLSPGEPCSDTSTSRSARWRERRGMDGRRPRRDAAGQLRRGYRYPRSGWPMQREEWPRGPSRCATRGARDSYRLDRRGARGGVDRGVGVNRPARRSARERKKYSKALTRGAVLLTFVTFTVGRITRPCCASTAS